MESRTLLPRLFLAALAAAASVPVAAQGLRPASWFVQAGAGENSVQAASVGVQWPWSWRGSALGGELTAHTELFASLWRARDFGGGRQNFVQLNLVPMLRYRFDAGRSPWFAEIGIGLSVTDKTFVTPDKTFSTRFNFSDNLALGRNFGAKGEHEVSLRWQHTSNAGIKKPNPGLDLVLVRYATSF